jgi:hypothetical protein
MDHSMWWLNRVIWLRPEATDPEFCQYAADDPGTRVHGRCHGWPRPFPGDLLCDHKQTGQRFARLSIMADEIGNNLAGTALVIQTFLSLF